MENPIPQAEKPRRLPPPQAEIVDEKIADYLKYNVIQESSGAWASPVHLVRRPGSDKVRMVCDLRKANTQLKDCKKYLNCVEENLNLVGPKCIFSKADLRSAYHMLNISEPFRDITAIVTQKNLYRFTVLPFGLSNAVAVFEMVMEKVFGSLDSNEISHYLDDFLLHSDDVEMHLKSLESFLRTVVAFRMKLSPDKCKFFKSEMEYLGVVVSPSGVKKSDEFCANIQQAEKPRTSHQMMKFLGLVNYQRRFIPSCSEIIRPLSKAIDHKCKKTKIIWTPEMDIAFDKIKQLMQVDLSLAYPDYSEDASEFQLYCDASSSAVAASLCQVQRGEFRVITHSSKSLDPTQLRWSTTDRELYALTWGILQHRHFLISRKFTVYCDHKPLKYLYTMKHVSPRLARTYEKLAEFDFQIEYVKGVDNEIADFFSRLSNKASNELHNEMSNALFQEVYIPSGFLEVPVPGGGDAMFDSLFAALQSIGNNLITSTIELRERCVDEILKNPRRFESDEERIKTFVTRIRGMRVVGVTPFLEVLCAAATITKLKIVLYVGVKQPLVFLPRVAKNCKSSKEFDARSETIYLIVKGEGCHYNWLTPLVAAETNILEHEMLFENPPSHEVEDEIQAEILNIQGAFVYNRILADQKDIVKDLEEEDRDAKLILANINTSWPPYDKDKIILLSSVLGIHKCNNLAHKKSDLTLKQGINEVCITFDTACSISTINEGALNTLDAMGAQIIINRNPTDVNIKALGDYNITPKGVAQVRIPCEVTDASFLDHTYLILPQDDMNQCILVGGDLLSTHGVSLSFVPRDLYNSRIEEPAHHVTASCKVISLYPTGRVGEAEIYEFMEQKDDAEVNIAKVTEIKNPSATTSNIPGNKRNKSKQKKKKDPYNRNDNNNNDHQAEFLIPVENIEGLQRSNSEINKMYRYIRDGANGKCPLPRYQPYVQNMHIIHDVLMHNQIPVVPMDAAVNMICSIHEEYSHCGRQKLLEKIDKCCWRPGIYSLLTNILRTCPVCQTMKTCTTRPTPPLLKGRKRHPFELIVADIVSLPRSSQGYTSALVLCDYCTKWIQIFPLKKHAASNTIKAIEQYLASIPKCPKFILTDGATEFRSTEFEEGLKKLGSKSSI